MVSILKYWSFTDLFRSTKSRLVLRKKKKSKNTPLDSPVVQVMNFLFTHDIEMEEMPIFGTATIEIYLPSKPYLQNLII